MDGNGCSIGTHILSYKPEFKNAMMNVPTVARAASALRNFSIW